MADECFEEFLGCFRGWELHKPQIPALTWLPQYDWRREFLSDVGAGLTVFFTLIPQGLAYSALAGMPPVYGLYAAGFPVIFYAFLGTSKHLVMGPYAITSLLVAIVCEQFPYPHGSEMYVKLALTLTVISGVMSLLAGMLRMGSMVQYLSTAVMSGFLTGCAVLIIISQIRNTFGISTAGHTFQYTHEKILYLLEHLGETQPEALAFSIPSFIVLYSANRWKRANPNTPDKANNAVFQTLFTLVNSSYFVVFLTTTVICSEIQRSANPMKHIAVVGYVPPGLQPSIFDSTVFSSSVIIKLIPQSIMIAFVAFSSNWAVVKRYSELFKYPVDPSQELFASGIVNIFGALFFNSFVNAGGMARTAVNAEAGGRSQVSCALAASLILITLSYFTPLTYDIPMAVLGSIIIAAVLSLVDTERMYKTYLIDKKECAVMVVTFILTVFVGIAPGIVLGIIVSMGNSLMSTAFASISQYGLLTDDTGKRTYRDLDKHPLAQEVPGVAILRMHANLYFANASLLKETCQRVANGEFHTDRSPGHAVRYIVVDMSASIDIDGLGFVNLAELCTELLARPQPVEVFFVNLRGPVQETFQMMDFFKKAGKATLVYASIDEAVVSLALKKEVLSVTGVAAAAKPPPSPLPCDQASLSVEMTAGESDRPTRVDLIPNPLMPSGSSPTSGGTKKRLLP